MTVKELRDTLDKYLANAPEAGSDPVLVAVGDVAVSAVSSADVAVVMDVPSLVIEVEF